MAAIRAYTTIEQSKKLAEFLPLDTADQCFLNDGTAIKAEINSYAVAMKLWKEHYIEIIPCWSLAALLEIIAKIASKIDDDGSADLSSFMGQWSVNLLDCPVEATDNYGNPVDACVEMILKLKEKNLI